MSMFYKSPVNNKINSGDYNQLKKDENLKYFAVNFFTTAAQAEKEPDIY